MKYFHYAEVQPGVLHPLSSLSIAAVTLADGTVVKVKTHTSDQTPPPAVKRTLKELTDGSLFKAVPK